MKLSLGWFALPLFFLAMASLACAQDKESIRQTKASFESGGKRIAVEIYTPAATAKKYPAVLVLHGAGGLLLDGPATKRFARALAQNGIEAFVIHYFDRTGTFFARDPSIHKNFDTWRATINDSVGFVASRKEVDTNAIGCFGYSLGAYLSLAQAAHDPRIAGVVELSGAADKKHAGLIKRMPPVLILHGDQDQRVPFENAQNLEAVLKKLGTPYEKYVYHGEGHVLSTASQKDAASRAVQFLKQHLKAR